MFNQETNQFLDCSCLSAQVLEALYQLLLFPLHLAPAFDILSKDLLEDVNIVFQQFLKAICELLVLVTLPFRVTLDPGCFLDAVVRRDAQPVNDGLVHRIQLFFLIVGLNCLPFDRLLFGLFAFRLLLKENLSSHVVLII